MEQWKDLITEVLEHPHLNLRPSVEISEIHPPLLTFLNLWEKWNKKINLTAEHDPVDFLTRHCFDSWQYARALELPGRVLDIGSGGGFPGIPLKIAFPELHLVMVESRRKRANFLSTIVRELALDKVEVHNCRAEELPEFLHGTFDQVLFKAVGPLGECLPLGAPFIRPRGRIILKQLPDIKIRTGVAESCGLHLLDTLSIHGYRNEASQLLVFGRESWVLGP